MILMALSKLLAFLHTKGYHEQTTFNVLIPKDYMNGQLLMGLYEGIHEQTTFYGTEGIN